MNRIQYFALAFLMVFASLLLAREEEDLTEHIKYLASDELEGRFPGTPGIAKAATYIETQFKEIGLEPVGGAYRQAFDVKIGKNVPEETNSVSFDVITPRLGVPMDRIRPVRKNWYIDTNWTPLGFSENGQASGEIVFAGFGISAPDMNYDDYAGIDVKDKIVIVVMDSPDGEEEKGDFARYASLRYKATNARDHGASAIVLVKFGGDSSHVLMKPTYENLGANSGIIAIQAMRNGLAEIFPRKQQLYPIQKEIVETKTPNSFVLPNITMNISVNLEDEYTSTDNVFGMIRGTKYQDEYIIIGAHYDHLGYGGPSSTYRGKKKLIHNGADDNASGVAGIIELARRIKENPIPVSAIFMAFSGEEMGLLGSSHYATNPLIPNSKVRAMLNLDMVGRLRDNKIKIFGIGTSNSFASLMDSLSIRDSIDIHKLSDGFGPSDHTSFYKEEIPVLHFFTGVHGDYHHPNDDWDKINYDGLSHLLDLVESASREIAGMAHRPDYVKVQMKEPSKEGKRYGTDVWFGIVPSFEETKLGCLISGTSAGSPAEKAGLKKDDVIVEIDGTLIKNLYDFMYKIREHKPGDVLNVKVLHGHNYQAERILKVTLVERD